MLQCCSSFSEDINTLVFYVSHSNIDFMFFPACEVCHQNTPSAPAPALLLNLGPRCGPPGKNDPVLNYPIELAFWGAVFSTQTQD